MRTISDKALDKLTTQYGLEAISIVRVYWSDNNYTDYADKEADGVEARIQSLSGLDDVVSVNNASSTSSVSVTLDDSDGQLKTIFNTTNIHKIRAQVLQWFDGIEKSEAFILLDGEINTPIVWSEGSRTLSFNIISLIENREFGFSAEEGQFPFLPDAIAGRPWPVVFGTVPRVPALGINKSPSTMLAFGFGSLNKTVYDFEKLQLQQKAADTLQKSQDSYAAGVAEAIIAARYAAGGTDFTPDPDPSAYQQHHQASQQFFAQSNDYMVDYQNLLIDIEKINFDYNQKEPYSFVYEVPGAIRYTQLPTSTLIPKYSITLEIARIGTSPIAGSFDTVKEFQVPVLSPDIPRGVPYLVEMGGDDYIVRVDGNTMTILSILGPEDLPRYDYFGDVDYGKLSRQFLATQTLEKFKWVQGGTRVRVINYPLKYILALGRATVTNVYGTHQGIKVKLTPTNYIQTYEQFTNELGETLWATVITLPTPLSSRVTTTGLQLWDSDDIYADLTGEVAGTFVDIISWTVQNFTNLTGDVDSWNHVKDLTLNVPMNFAFFDRVNALEFINTLAFQAKVAVWIKNRVLFMRYLPERPTPVDTISDTDILENSLEVTSTETEELVTKFVGSWKFLLDQDRANETIYRNYIARYGLRVDNYNYFAFNNVEAVKWSMRYWIIRKSNTWKKIRFKTLIHKLRLETFDAVTIDLPRKLISNAPVVGIIEKAVFDSSSNEIDMEVWLPIRLGEMDEYIFGYPAGITTVFPINYTDAFSGSPWDGVLNPIFFEIAKHPYMSVNLGSSGTREQVPPDSYNPNNENFSVATQLDDAPVPIISNPPAGLRPANNYKRVEVTPPVDYSPSTKNESFIGYIQSQFEGNSYMVAIPGKTDPVKVKQVLIDDSTVIPNGTPVMIVKQDGSYLMQVPIWLQRP